MSEEIKNFVIEFDYNIETLNQIKEEVSKVDRTNIEEIESTVKKLVKVRRAIETKGKTYRDEANAFNKMVLSKEKEYVDIIEPLEIEYKELLEKEKERQVIEARKALLPNKKRQLSVLKIEQPDDERILAMDEETWIAFYDEKFAEHEYNVEQEERKIQEEKDRKIFEEEQAKERSKREEEIKREEQERAKKDKEEYLKRAEEEKLRAVEEAKREADERVQKEKQELADKERRHKEEQEEKEREEERKRLEIEADKKYQEFLTVNNFNQSTDKLERDGTEIRIYRLLATFNTK